MPVTSRRLLDEEFIAKIEQLELVSKKLISGAMKGERLSRRRGRSNEFADFRPYAAGDDLRFLDWNVYARLDRLFLKLFLEEEDLRVTILIDRSPSMDYGSPPKLEYAKKIAAALGYIGLSNQDRVDIVAFGEQPQPLFGPARGRRHVQRLLDTLQALEADESQRTDLEASCRSVAVSGGGGSGGIVLFLTDFFDRAGFEKGLRWLAIRGRTAEVFAFHVLSPQEIEPDVTGDLRLVDVEDGGVVEVSVSAPLLRTYRRTLEGFQAEIRDYCSRRSISYVPAPTDVPFDRLVLEYLRRRGLLR
jgi:uncharacterized protein (DUF58 family)